MSPESTLRPGEFDLIEPPQSEIVEAHNNSVRSRIRSVANKVVGWVANKRGAHDPVDTYADYAEDAEFTESAVVQQASIKNLGATVGNFLVLQDDTSVPPENLRDAANTVFASIERFAESFNFATSGDTDSDDVEYAKLVLAVNRYVEHGANPTADNSLTPTRLINSAEFRLGGPLVPTEEQIAETKRPKLTSGTYKSANYLSSSESTSALGEEITSPPNTNSDEQVLNKQFWGEQVDVEGVAVEVHFSRRTKLIAGASALAIIAMMATPFIPRVSGASPNSSPSSQESTSSPK